MELLPVKVRPLRAPKDDLFAALTAAKLALKDGDIVAISSKVVSIHEGRTVPVDAAEKASLVEREAEWLLRIPGNKHKQTFTIAKGSMAGSAGIDESNGNGHYILYPEDPFRSAKRLRTRLMRAHGLKRLGVLVTDSTSHPLRRGAIGFALSWDGFVPLKDYRKKTDLFGRPFKVEVANLADGLAGGAVVAMGEGNEGTPVVIVRGTPVEFGNRKTKEPLITAPEKDMFSPLLFARKWRKGGGRSRSGTARRSPRASRRSPGRSRPRKTR